MGMKCSYDCGNDGIFQFKNGNFCCSSNWAKCPSIREKNRRSAKIKTTIQTKIKCDICKKDFRKINFNRHVEACAKFNICKQCGNKIPRWNKFCNKICAAIYNNKNSEKLKFCKRGGVSSTSFKPKDPQNYIKPSIVKDDTIYVCLNCLKPKRSKKYCSLQCKIEYEFKLKVKLWLNKEVIHKKPEYFMKKYLLNLNNNSCSKCGWNILHPTSKKCPLHFHHKDGNWQNNIIENIEILCPNCYSLTENFGSRNKNNGKIFMRDYYKIYSYLKSHKDVYQDLIDQKRKSVI